MEQVSFFESRFWPRGSSGMLPGMLGLSSPAATVDAPERVIICDGRPPVPDSPATER